jgi:hypothetical protein
MSKFTKTLLTMVAFTLMGVSAVSINAQGYGGGGGGGGFVFSSSYVTNPFAVIPTVNAGNGTVGQVLGASTTAANCANFITRFGTVGSRGTDVTKLQQFLIKYEGAKFNATGYYGPLTRNAVRAFQAKNGINPTSGMQYSKTTKVVNDQYCAHVAGGKGL